MLRCKEVLEQVEMVLEAMLDAQKQLFFPEMAQLLQALKEKGQVYYTQPMLPEILWDSYTVLYKHLMMEAVRIQRGGGTAASIQFIEAERFLWERLLDAPFASMELIRADEALRTVSHAISKIKRLEAAQGEA